VTFDGITGAACSGCRISQINVVVPWSVNRQRYRWAGRRRRFVSSYNNVPTNCLGLPVAQTAPGVFTVDGAYAAAVNQDGTTNSATTRLRLAHSSRCGRPVSAPSLQPRPMGTLVGSPLPTDVLQAAVGFDYRLSALLPSGQYFIPFVTTYAGPASV